jgi:hypothetical protein
MRHGLRSHRTYARRYRPIRRRSAIVLALATAGVLAVAGIALATATSTVPGFSFTPNNPDGVFTLGKLSFHTNTTYTSATRVSRIQLQLDDDFQFNPSSFPKCNPADLSGAATMQQAMQKCGPPAGAAKNAWLWPPTANTSNGTALIDFPNPATPACVLVFNGQGSASELLLFLSVKVGAGSIYCGSPTTNTDGNGSALLKGDLKQNPATVGGDYTDPDTCTAPDPRQGCQIDINMIDSSVPFLIDLNVSIRRSSYVRARCVDPPAGNRLWNLRAAFTYVDPPSSQSPVFKSQTCT